MCQVCLFQGLAGRCEFPTLCFRNSVCASLFPKALFSRHLESMDSSVTAAVTGRGVLEFAAY